MIETQKQRLERQLWSIANKLRGKMDADEFRDYFLGFIFYKYLSEKQHLFANSLLETEAVKGYALVSDADDLEAKIPLPHPHEQRKIADFLSAIDTKIDLVAQELEQANAFKKGLLQQMFV